MAARGLQRVASRIKFLVSHVLQREISDPRLGFVTILKVEPTVDLREAKVYFSVLGGRAERSKTLHALEDARGYIQRRVGKGLHLRHTPLLHFVLDDSQDSIERIESILRREREERQEDSRQEDS